MPNPPIGIKQLQMMIKTGIPGKEEYIEFNSSLLPVKSKGKPFAKYPFFSDTHAYPKIKLQDFSYERVVEFFFNKEVFTKLIRNKTQKNLPKPNLQKMKVDNFELTLRLLFPTTYPLVNNIDNSVEYIIPSKKLFTLKGSNTFAILPRRFDRKYSYLNIDSETYTITKTVWNNDVMNHPIYSEFIESYREFDTWKSDPSLNVFQDKNAFVENMDIIISYVYDAVQKSDEDPLFKKMYTDESKAPYLNSSKAKALDANTLAIQDFDNAIDELMRKDTNALQLDISNNEIEYNRLYGLLISDLSNSNITITTTPPTTTPPTTSKIIEEIKKKHDTLEFIDHDDYTKLNKNIIKTINDDSTTDNTTKKKFLENINEIISVLESIQKKNQDISKLKLKKKNNSDSDYYIFLTKQKNENNKVNKKKELLEKDKKYKSNLINLLGKLASVKKESYHNISPDFLNLIDYLKTNVTDFNIKRRISTFIKDLNIKFLSNPDEYKKELEKIKSLYVEFYNLALVINGLKGRKIDNQIWRDAILKMMNGTLEENYFNDKIWEPLQDCYHLDDDDEESKKKKSGKKCNPDVISVGLDIIPSSKNENVNANDNANENKNNAKNAKNTSTRKTTIPTIEIFLQMDLIEGKIDDTNVSKIKCAYDDEFLGSMFRDLINTGKQINTFPAEQVFFSAKKLLSDTTTAAPTTTTAAKKGGKTRNKHHRSSHHYTKKNN
jgi:hypothetical protein